MFSAGLPTWVQAGVLGHFRQLRDVAELVRLAELALADRSRLGVEQRHDPVADRLARYALGDLPRDLLAPIGQLLQRGGRAQLRLRAAATLVRSGRG